MKKGKIKSSRNIRENSPTKACIPTRIFHKQNKEKRDD